jgi:hypothetical protein
MTVPRRGLVLLVAALALVPTLRLLAADEPTSSHWQTITTRARVMSIAFEGHDVWLGLFGGVMRHDLRTERDFDLYTPANTGGQLLSTGVYTIEVDRNGDKWVGTYGGGLAKFDGSRWTTYSVRMGPLPIIGIPGRRTPGRGLGDLWSTTSADRRGRMGRDGKGVIRSTGMVSPPFR